MKKFRGAAAVALAAAWTSIKKYFSGLFGVVWDWFRDPSGIVQGSLGDRAGVVRGSFRGRAGVFRASFSSDFFSAATKPPNKPYRGWSGGIAPQVGFGRPQPPQPPEKIGKKYKKIRKILKKKVFQSKRFLN